MTYLILGMALLLRPCPGFSAPGAGNLSSVGTEVATAPSYRLLLVLVIISIGLSSLALLWLVCSKGLPVSRRKGRKVKADGAVAAAIALALQAELSGKDRTVPAESRCRKEAVQNGDNYILTIRTATDSPWRRKGDTFRKRPPLNRRTGGNI